MARFLLDPAEYSGDESDSGSSLVDFVDNDIRDGVKFTLNLLDKDVLSSLPRGPEIPGLLQLPSLECSPRKTTHRRITPQHIENNNKRSSAELQFSERQQGPAAHTLQEEDRSTWSGVEIKAVYQMVEGKRSYRCSQCFFTKVTKAAVEHHINVSHGQKNYLACHLCHFKTFNPDCFRQHKKKCLNKFQCQLCPFSTTRTGDITRHRRTHQKTESHKERKISPLN